MSTNSSEKVAKVPVYWSTILLGLIVAAIFLVAIFSYQVQETERALVITWGKITGEQGPGLHLRPAKTAMKAIPATWKKP